MEPSNQVNKLQEQANLMNLALESVLTEEQAVELIQGKIRDAYLLKIRIDIENRSGAVVALVTKYKNEVIEIFSLFSNSSLIRKIRSFQDSAAFALDMVEAAKSEPYDPGLSDSIGRIVYSKLTKAVLESSYANWDKNDASSLVNILENQIKTSLKVNIVRIQADVEFISSLKFRAKNVFTGIIPTVNRPIEEPSIGQVPESQEKTPVQRQIDQFRKPFGRVILSKTVLAPVGGVDFDELTEGDRLYFQLPTGSMDEKAMAKTLGGIDEDGNVRNVVGEFIGIAAGKGEYHIFAKGPSGVLLQAFEERPVRLAKVKTKTSSSASTTKTETSSGGGSLGIIIVAGVVLVVGLLVFLIMK
ncbi:LIC10486 family protein [Leptospira interrogans]|uniref:LIC10486 family protein n=1 Tax=Leptospira interrogans TaxID=173 RepID=UPI0040350A8A